MVGCFFSDGPRCQDSDVFANQLEQRWATYCSTCRHVFPWFAPGSEPVWDEPNKFCSTSRQNNIHDGFSGCKLGVRSILKIVQAQSDVLRTQWPRKLERGQGLSNSINSTSPHFTQSECVFVCVDEIVALGGVALGVPAARCDCDLRSFQQILVCRNQNHGFPLRKIWCPFIWKKNRCQNGLFGIRSLVFVNESFVYQSSPVALHAVFDGWFQTLWSLFGGCVTSQCAIFWGVGKHCLALSPHVSSTYTAGSGFVTRTLFHVPRFVWTRLRV